MPIYSENKEKSLGRLGIDCRLNKYFSFKLAYGDFGKKCITVEPLYSGHAL